MDAVRRRRRRRGSCSRPMARRSTASPRCWSATTRTPRTCVQETFLKLLRHLEAGRRRRQPARLAVHGGGARGARSAARRGALGALAAGARGRGARPSSPDEDGRLKIARDGAAAPARARSPAARAARAGTFVPRHRVGRASSGRPRSGRLLARAVGSLGGGRITEGRQSYDLLERQSHPGAR